MVKLALVDRALGSSVSPTVSAANLRHQHKHQSITLADSFSLEKRKSETLQEKNGKTEDISVHTAVKSNQSSTD